MRKAIAVRSATCSLVTPSSTGVVSAACLCLSPHVRTATLAEHRSDTNESFAQPHIHDAPCGLYDPRICAGASTTRSGKVQRRTPDS